MADISFTITNAGRGALVAAGTNGTLPVQITHCGVSPNALTPAATATSLPSEVKRIGVLAGNAVASDTIHLIVEDASADTYDVKSLALYLADGTLFAIYGQATSLLSKSASAILLLAADIKFADIAASSISFGNTNFLNPPATESTQGVAEIATQAEANAGTDDVRFITAKKAKAAILAWLGFTPANKAGDTFTGDVRVQGIVEADTPNNSTTGGVRIRGNATSGFAYLQITNAAADAEWGSMRWNAAGDWRYQGNVVWHAGNDGSGSGLDADLLDGKDWTGGQDVVFGKGDFATPNAGTTGALRMRGNPVSGFAIMQITDGPASNQWGYWKYAADGMAEWNGGAGLRTNGNLNWHAGNDGSGSGSDSDMLDGLHASSFVQQGDFGSRSMSSNGHYQLPGGLIFQWGSFTSTPNGSTTVNLPRAFPNGAFSVVVSGTSSFGVDSKDNQAAVTAIGASSFTVFSADDTANQTFFIAIGH